MAAVHRPARAAAAVLVAVCCCLILPLAPQVHAQFASLFCPAPPASQQVWPFPVNTNNVCGHLQLDQPNNEVACAAFGLLESLLVGPTGLAVICSAGNQTVQQLWLPKSVDKQGRPLPQVLPDRRTAAAGSSSSSSSSRQLPATLPASVMDAEGATYNWLYKVLTVFARWAPCDLLHTPTAWTLPAGWKLVRLANITGDLSEDGLPADASMPMLAVLKQQQRRSRPWVAGSRHRAPATGSRLIILVRGTLTAYERHVDFDYNMLSDASYADGLMHKGFKLTADQLWQGGLQQALDDEILAGGSSSDVTFSGHSLGAGVATLLAGRTQKYLSQKQQEAAYPGRQDYTARPADARPSPAPRPPLVTAVLFAAPNVGNATFVVDFNRRVNGRNIEFAHDLISQIPCTPLTTACTNAPTPTTNPEGAWPYARIGGVVRFSGGDMPLQTAAWQKLAAYQQSDFCASQDSLRWLNQAAHICSYLCRTSVYVSDTENWCLLWPVTPGCRPGSDAATHCMVLSGRNEFPKTPIFPALGP